MHKLTDNEYLPALTAGYSFSVSPRTDGFSGLRIDVYRLPRVGQKPHHSEYVSAPKEQLLNRNFLRVIILRETKKIASMGREWNPEFSRNLREVMAELIPPKDDVPDDDNESDWF